MCDMHPHVWHDEKCHIPTSTVIYMESCHTCGCITTLCHDAHIISVMMHVCVGGVIRYKTRELSVLIEMTLWWLSKIVGLCCKRALSKRRYSAQETYNFKESHQRVISVMMHPHVWHDFIYMTVLVGMWHISLVCVTRRFHMYPPFNTSDGAFDIPESWLIHVCVMTHPFIHSSVCVPWLHIYVITCWYGVAMTSRLLKIVSLCYKRAL